MFKTQLLLGNIMIEMLMEQTYIYIYLIYMIIDITYMM